MLIPSSKAITSASDKGRGPLRNSAYTFSASTTPSTYLPGSLRAESNRLSQPKPPRPPPAGVPKKGQRPGSRDLHHLLGPASNPSTSGTVTWAPPPCTTGPPRPCTREVRRAHAEVAAQRAGAALPEIL